MKHLPVVVAMIAIAVPCAAVDIATKVGTTGTYNYVVDGSDGLLYRTLHGDGTSQRFDIAIVGDGYQKTDADQWRFRVAVEKFVAGLFAVSPFSEAREYINISLVNIISDFSGISDPDVGLVHDTALDCSFVTGSMEITGTTSTLETTNKAFDACNLAGVAFDVVYVIVNDSKGHDGSWANYTSKIAYSSDLYPWGTIIAHELGHLIADLADEYRAPDCNPCASNPTLVTFTGEWIPDEPNVTTAADRSLVPWSDLLQTEAFPTTIDSVSDGDTIGRWEGAAMDCFGIYRPREYCLMDGTTGDDPLIDDFCPVCVRAIVERLEDWHP